MAKVTIKLKTWIPQKEIIFTDDGYTRVSYGGDGRSESWTGTYRTLQQFVIDTSSTYYTVTATKDTGTTHQYVYDYKSGQTQTTTGKASTSGLTYSKLFMGNNLILHAVCDSANPLQIGAPAINYDFRIGVNRNGDVSLVGDHDGFPGYELWKQPDGGTAKLLWSHDPRDTDENISIIIPTNGT